MQIELLQEFAVLSVTKNFSEAAVQLHMSQPTLSRHMDMLEKELKCKLLNRTRPITLTPIGKKLLPYINEEVRAYQRLTDFTNSMRTLTYVELRIQDLSFAPLVDEMMTQCENRLLKDHPELSFRHIEPAPGRTLEEQLQSGFFDIFFLHAFGEKDKIEPPIQTSEIEVVALPRLQRNISFIGRKDNEVFLNKNITLKDCRNLQFLTPAERFLDIYRAAFSVFCKTYGGFEPRFEFREMDSHHHFYAKDPGDGFHILSDNGDGGSGRAGMLPHWLAQEMKAIVLEDYFSIIFACYLKSNSKSGIKTFIDVLNRCDLQDPETT